MSQDECNRTAANTRESDNDQPDKQEEEDSKRRVKSGGQRELFGRPKQGSLPFYDD
jgi:hypothetical protein